MQKHSDEGLLQVRENNVWVPTSGHCSWKIVRTCEIRIPLDTLKLNTKCKLFASITLVRDSEEIGRWPSDASLMLYYAGAEIELENWFI
jgi:hypothetical protein